MKNAEYTIFDLEWTTKSKTSKELYIIEIGAIRVKNGKLFKRFHKLLRYRGSISPIVQKLTGITTEALKFGEDRKKVLLEFLEFSKNSILVAHDINNDMKVLREEYRRFNLEINREQLCSLQLARKVFTLKKYSILAIADFLNLRSMKLHRASNDAFVAYKVLEYVLNIIPDDIDTLDKLNNWRSMKKFLIRDEVAGIQLDKRKGYQAFFDGASFGNPGHLGAGFIILNKDKVIYKYSKYVGVGTNNEAEYIAMISLLQFAVKSGIRHLKIFGDSQLVINQISGEWRVKAEHLVVLLEETKTLIEKIPFISIEWIRREENKLADELSKEGARKR